MRSLLDRYRVVDLPTRLHADCGVVVSIAQAREGVGERDVLAIVRIDKIKWFCRNWGVPGPQLVGDVGVLKPRLIDNLRAGLPGMANHICLTGIVPVIASRRSSAAATASCRQLPLLRITEEELLVRLEVVVKASSK